MSISPTDPPAAPWIRVGAYAIVTDESSRILLCRIAPGYPAAGMWTLPGGGVDHGEHPDDAVLRELREETGLAGNTLVVFASDHGEMLGERGMWFKQTFYEGSARVPPEWDGPYFGFDHVQLLLFGHMLRVAPQWEEGQKAPPVRSFSLEVRSGVFRWTYVLLAFLAIVFWPLVQVMRVSAFEGRRWQESMYTTTGESS